MSVVPGAPDGLLSAGPIASGVRATKAAFSPYLARNVWAGRIADDATCDQADRPEDDRAREATQSRVGHPFVRVGGDRRKQNTGGYDNKSCKGFHKVVPSIVRPP